MTVLGVRLHFRRDRALGDEARSADSKRYEVGSGPEQRIGSSSDADPFIARGSPGEVVRDNHPISKVVVLPKTNKHIHVDIGIDGFQRKDYSGGVLGNLQPEREISIEERRVVNRPQAEGGGLSGYERTAAYRHVSFHCRRDRALGDDARSADSKRDEVGSSSERRVGSQGNDNLLVAEESLGGVVRDNRSVSKVVVLSKADIQIHVDKGIHRDRQSYAVRVFGNLQPEREISIEERRVVNRPQAENGGLSGHERTAAYRRRSHFVDFHFRCDRALGDDARSADSIVIRSRFLLEAADRIAG